MSATSTPTPVNSLAELEAAFAQAGDISTMLKIASRTARDLTGADGASVVLREGEHCCYVEEDAIEPLWKGRRFPLSACVSGWAIRNNAQVVIEDIYRDPRIPAAAYKPTFVRSLAMAPVGRHKPIGSIGNYWARIHNPTRNEVASLQSIADLMFAAIALHDGNDMRAALHNLTADTR
jgi:GAF domain-containing protein